MKMLSRLHLTFSLALLAAACGGSSAGPSAAPAPTPTPLPRGDVTDASGDAASHARVPISPDLVLGSIEITAGGLAIFNVQFAPDTFRPDTTLVQFELDADQNASTGASSNGLGLEYILNMGSLANPLAEVKQWRGGNTYETVITAPVSVRGNGLEVAIPLSGVDDGRVNFRVSTSSLLSFNGIPSQSSFTTILDFMPNTNLPPGVVR